MKILRKHDVTIDEDEFISSEGVDPERIAQFTGLVSIPAPTRLETPTRSYEVRSFWEPRGADRR